MANTENGFYNSQKTFQQDPNLTNRKDNVHGFYGNNVRPADVIDYVKAAQDAAKASEGYSKESEQFKNETEQLKNDTQQIKDAVDITKGEIDQIKTDTEGFKNAAETAATNSASSAAASEASNVSATGQANRAEQEADRAEQAAQATANGVINRGTWDASTGNFPTPTTTPVEKADWYRIDTQGTMTNANPSQPDITVTAGDNLYWDTINDVWYAIASDNAPWQSYAMKQADMEVMIQQNKDARAASGFDHYGKHITVNSFPIINEGLNGRTDASNHILMGRITTGQQGGSSETPYPVTAIAGLVSNIIGVNDNPLVTGAKIKFDKAPRGVDVFDSSGNARGTGRFKLDLTKDTDPKYGDVASDENEAAARAFEGALQNGDFRNGGTNWVLGSDGRATVANNTLAFKGTNSGSTQSVYTDYTNNSIDSYFPAGTTVVCDVDISDNVGYINLILRSYGNSGQQQNVLAMNGVDGGKKTLSMTMTEDARSLRFIVETQSGGGTGEVKVHSVSIRPATEEVVIDRHDVFGGEFFMEEVTQVQPYVYPKGMLQSQATTMNGIATSDSARPDTYYAVFTGDTTSRGKGVDFYAASQSEKKAMLSDKSNNIFLLDDGRLVQWRMRQRTLTGYGNGDWYNTDSTGDAIGFQTTPFLQPASQGILDSVNEYFIFGEDKAGYYGTTNATPLHNDPAVFKAGISGAPTSDVAVGGECYFHVWGRVRRLNQGAYHPSFNPLGARGWRSSNAAGNISGTTDYRLLTKEVDKPKATNDAFRLNPTGVPAQRSASDTSGFIGQGTGYTRPDGKYYDATYHYGEGGVNDDRLSSWDMEDETEKAMVKVVAGKFRGEEKRIKWKIKFKTSPSASSTAIYPASALGVDLDGMVGGAYFNISTVYTANYRNRKCWIRITATGGATLTTGTALNTWYVADILPHVTGKQILLNPNTGTTRWIDSGSAANLTIDIAAAVYTNSTVSSSFMQVDVVGDPENIVKSPDFVNGWEGDWAGEANGSGGRNFLTRYSDGSWLPSDAMPIYQPATDSWTTYTRPVNATRGYITSVGTGDVGIIYYVARSYVTKEFNARKYVLGGYAPIDNVYTTMHRDPSRGGMLRESFLGVVDAGYGTGGADALPHSESIGLMSKAMLDGRPNGSSGTNTFSWRHPQTELGIPAYNSQAIKTVSYPYSTNQKVGLAFMWNEMRWVGDYANIGVIAIEDANRTDDGVQHNVYLPNMTDNVTFKNALMLNRKLLKCLNGFTASWNDAGWITTGSDAWGRTQYRYSTAPTGIVGLVDYGSRGDLWGDLGYIWAADTSTEFFWDYNRTLLPAGNHILSKPIGFTKNKARFGTQQLGVDL